MMVKCQITVRILRKKTNKKLKIRPRGKKRSRQYKLKVRGPKKHYKNRGIRELKIVGRIITIKRKPSCII